MINWQPKKWLGIGLGYNLFDVDVDVDGNRFNGSLDWRLQGTDVLSYSAVVLGLASTATVAPWPAFSAARGRGAQSHLDPASHMGEILFGLIMTLTFTLGGGHRGSRRRGGRVPARCWSAS